MIVLSIFITGSLQAKVFNVTNQQTNQTIKVSCVFPNSIQCQRNLEEAKYRVKNQTNPGATTLTDARMQDNSAAISNSISNGYNNTRDAVQAGAQRTQEQLRVVGGNVSQGVQAASERVSSDAAALRDSAQAGAAAVGSRIQSGAAAVGNSIQSGASALGDRAQAAAQTVSEGAQQVAQDVRGKTYRVSIPGIDHSMTFHCHGGMESEECQKEKDEVVEAIKSGSTSPTLAQHNLRPVTNAVAAVVDTAESTGRSAASFLSRQNHAYCNRKLIEHAKEFDQHYNDSGQQHLVSYTEKMDFIKDKLIADNKFNTCEEHFENALLGHQLKVVSGQVVRENTHIFDGLGRLPDGGSGYWKSEQRNSRYGERTISQ